MSIPNSNRQCSRDTTANMVNVLAKQNNGLKICHLNAQSLVSKMDEFRFIFENSDLHVICVSETWLNKSIVDTMVAMNGFNMHRADRDDGYGGVAIYVKKGFTCNVKSRSGKNINDKVEHLFLEICSLGSKILVGSVYRPHSHIDFSHFYSILSDITPLYNDVVIAGDFNSNILVDSSFAVCMESYGLFTANRISPTHFSSTNSTLLDLFFVSDSKHILTYNQLSASCFSKHDLIFMIYNVPLQTPCNTIQFRDFRNVNWQKLQEEYSKIDWNCIYQMLSVDDQLTYLERNVTTLYDIIIPIKTKKISNRDKPWFTSEIKSLIGDREYAYSRWKRYKSSELQSLFRLARRRVTMKIREAKSKYYADKFSNSIDTKQKWKTIKEIGIGKHKSNVDNTITDPNEINKTFVNIPMPQANHLYYENNSAFNYQQTTFNFDCVSQIEVLNSCLSINSNATGVDGIHPTFLKMLLPSLLPFITHTFNKILMTSIFPQKWKQAKVLPIPKSNTEYRPIAILPYLSKAFERILHHQMTTYIKTNNLLTECQSGFRAKHSCVTALVDVVEDIRREADDGRVTMLVLLDHSKAFDTVDHIILVQKLKYMLNFSSTSVALMTSYLNNRAQCVEIGSKTSRFLSVNRGVPQGSILGPLLFSIYSNDLPNHLIHSKIRMYADDVQLYISNKIGNLEHCTANLNEDLQRVAQWASRNGLSINPQKSKCILIRGRLQKIATSPIVRIGNQQIEIVTKAKNLGLIINSTLTWSDHIVAACGKTFSMLRTLWPTQYCTPIKIRLLLAKTYLIPILTYACEVFASCDENSKSRLKVTYNSIARYVYGIRRYDHVTSHSKMIYGVDFEALMKIRVLIFLHKIIFTREPEHLYNRLSFSRLRRNNNIIQFRHHTLISEWQFYIFAVRLWNSLPSVIKLISNVLQFKKRIFEFYS